MGIIILGVVQDCSLKSIPWRWCLLHVGFISVVMSDLRYLREVRLDVYIRMRYEYDNREEF